MEIPGGLCQCGCCQPAPIAKRAGDGYRKGESKKFIQGHSSHNRRGEQAAHWKGGRRLNHNGYVLVRLPEHPRANPSGYVFEHILVMEKVLGRSVLVTEHPHHINGVKTDNSPGNLMLFKTNGMHRSYHERLKAYEECGHYNWRKCFFCHRYDAQKNMNTEGKGFIHKDCRRTQSQQRRDQEKALP